MFLILFLNLELIDAKDTQKQWYSQMKMSGLVYENKRSYVKYDKR